MQTSEKTTELYKAYFAAQHEMRSPKLNAVNPHFRSKYADLPEIMSVVKPVCEKHGIAIIQSPGVYDGSVMTLTTRIIHAESGQWMEATIGLPLDKATAQGGGSGITYMRRYAVAAMFALVADEDDDGNSASRTNSNGNGNVRKAISEKEMIGLREKFDTLAEDDRAKFLEWAKVDDIAKLPPDKYDQAIAGLNRKLGAAA